MRTSARHRAPSRWCHLEDEDVDQVTVAELLGRNQGLLSWYRLVRARREHAGPPQRVVVIPRQRTAADQRATCAYPPPRVLERGTARLPTVPVPPARQVSA